MAAIEERPQGQATIQLTDSEAPDEKMLEEDENMLDSESGWKLSREVKEARIKVYEWRKKGEPLWIKITREMQGVSVAQLKDILHTNIVQKQDRWHELFIKGEYIYCQDYPHRELLYMAYKSTFFLISPRDFLYWKLLKELPSGGFLLSYRPIPSFRQ